RLLLIALRRRLTLCRREGSRRRARSPCTYRRYARGSLPWHFTDARVEASRNEARRLGGAALAHGARHDPRRRDGRAAHPACRTGRAGREWRKPRRPVPRGTHSAGPHLHTREPRCDAHIPRSTVGGGSRRECHGANPRWAGRDAHPIRCTVGPEVAAAWTRSSGSTTWRPIRAAQGSAPARGFPAGEGAV